MGGIPRSRVWSPLRAERQTSAVPRLGELRASAQVSPRSRIFRLEVRERRWSAWRRRHTAPGPSTLRGASVSTCDGAPLAATPCLRSIRVAAAPTPERRRGHQDCPATASRDNLPTAIALLGVLVAGSTMTPPDRHLPAVRGQGACPSVLRVRGPRALPTGPTGGPMRNGGGAGLTTVRQVPATAARESNL
jgi:hypothetical protein